MEPVGPQAGTNADGVRIVGDILRHATNARWPMYVRNVKQLLRAHRGEGAGAESAGAEGDGAPGAVTPGGFDERRYGFGGLMDLLKACQREGLLRVERDRRGGLRVFPGQALQRTEQHHAELVQPQPIEERQPMVATPPEPADDPDLEIGQPIPVDTTAELLGRAKAKRPRARAVAAPRGTRKAAAARKPAARRAATARKAPRPDAADGGE
jgi:hypothetical protein